MNDQALISLLWKISLAENLDDVFQATLPLRDYFKVWDVRELEDLNDTLVEMDIIPNYRRDGN